MSLLETPQAPPPSAPPATEPASGPVPRAASLPDRGCVGYLAKMFPRVSETFILDEILALRRHGVPVRIYSMLPPVRDARIHPQAAALLPEVEILPAPGARSFLADLASCFAARPVGTSKITLRTLLWPTGHRFRRLARALALAARLRRHRVAHLHAAWAHTPASVARLASRLSGVPWSMGAHAKDIHLSRPASLAKKLASARFTTVCSAANHALLRGLAPPSRSGLPGPEIELVHHGVDSEYFAPARELRTEPPLVLSVGRLVRKKGFDALLEAAAKLVQRGHDFRLEIVGEGVERDRLREKIRALGLQDVVRLRGLMLRDEVRLAMRRATCFALACRVAEDGDRDGIPNTLAEAMACGLPVVATRLPGVEELVEHGSTGLLVPPDDADALAAALGDLLEDPARRSHLGDRARARVSRDFDAARCGARRAARLERALGVERVLYLSADRGVPVRGDKGASVHVRSLVGAWRARGVETVILTASAGPRDGVDPGVGMLEHDSGKAWKSLIGALARRLGGGRPLERALLRLLDNLPLMRAGRRLTDAWKPDLVYERYALTSIAGAWLARHCHVSFILEVNAPLVEEEARFRGLRLGWLARAAERWVMRRADYVVVVSEALALHVRRQGVARERVLVLPNGVDRDAFHPNVSGAEVRRTYQLDGHCVVGFCGSLKPWHGVRHLLDAVALAATRAPELRLLVIGEGPERASLEARTRALGLEGRVHFAGAVPHPRVPSHLAACDILAAPYEAVDGFYFSPLKLAEYRAMGRPVVGSAVPGTDRQDDPMYLTVPAADPRALSDALVTFARERSRFSPAPPAGQWSWSDVANAVLEAAHRARTAVWRWRAD